MSEGTVLSRVVSTLEPPAGEIRIVASEADRTALAAAYDLIAVKSLEATMTIGPSSGGVTVEGRVVADIVQTCVVSLVPVEEHIDEVFDVRYVRDPNRLLQPGTEVVVDAGVPDPPELLEGPSLDIGRLAEEYFALAINPYPRAPGAELPADTSDGDAASNSPFAALAALAKKPNPRV
jgi:hypothetical protein